MTVASLVHSNFTHSRSFACKQKARQGRRTKRCLACILICAIFICITGYVLTTNSIAARGYKIGGLEKQVHELDTANKILQIDISNLKSISVLEANSNNIQMVKAQRVEYVSTAKTSAMLSW